MLLKSLPLVSGLLLPAAAETILGVTVFSRHGDRTSKHYKGYSLTSLGEQQVFSVGSDYRSRYISSESDKQILGISENRVRQSQIFASAPDQEVLLNTANSFLQGLYPPLEGIDAKIASETLANGSEVTSPLNGYQYVVLHSEESEAPDTIWLKGDENCPSTIKSQEAFAESKEFKELDEKTKSFYEKFYDILKDVYDYSPEKMSYENAYDIFDLINVAHIHNDSSAAEKISDEDLFQLRTLADSAEFSVAYSSSEPERAIGGKTFAGAVLNQLSQTVSGKGKLKFSLLAGSYDIFQSFFGISKLIDVDTNFYGLPEYASTMSFELFTNKDVEEFPSNTDDLRVRFLFRNGSSADAQLRAFPLFGKSEDSMSWADFVSSMKDVAITSAEEWCNTCQSSLLFCAAYGAADAVTTTSSGSSGISSVIAGVIGAMVTLAVFSIIGAVAFFAVRGRRASPAVTQENVIVERKGSYYSESDAESHRA